MAGLSARSRRWCFTQNGEVPPEWDPTWMTYLVYGVETAPTTGHIHYQGYVETATRITRNALSAKAGWEGIHLEVARGDGQSNVDYCCKDGQWVEWGELMNQGARHDLDQVVAEIISGDLTVRDVLLSNPMQFHQYGRTLTAAEDARLLSETRGAWAPPQVAWFYGKSGAGKSRTARDEAAALGLDVYVLSFNDHGWWDNYQGQKAILLDDYRGNLPFGELLRMTDGYEYWVPRRNRPPRPLLATHIWITSRKQPEESYDREKYGDEDMAQLYRRITDLRFFGV